jgi:hypothetical protein
MAAKRAFSEDDVPRKAEDYHGLAKYLRTQPDVATRGVKSINLEMSFEEAIKMSLAIQACLIQLTRYNRRSVPGRKMGLLLSIKTASKTITVIEKRVSPGATA